MSSHGMSDAPIESEDLLGMDQSPTKRQRTSSPTALRLEHFTCKYDPTWDYEKIAEDMYDGPRYLVMLEKISTNAHVHFQGETTYAERTFANKRQKLSATHFIRKLKPSSRPVKGKKEPATELGFQYVCKELNEPLAYKGFTLDELEEMHDNSNMHVKEKKEKMKDYVKEMSLCPTEFMGDDSEHACLFYKVLLDVDRQLKIMDKEPSRYTKRDVANGLRAHKHCNDSMTLWLYKHNMF